MNKIKLDIGSGRAKLEGYVTLDKDLVVGADICIDFEKVSIDDFTITKVYWTGDKKSEVINYKNNVDEIRAHHILEHFRPDNKVKVMALFWDLLKPGGILDIEVPLFPHPASVQDPTHLSFWCEESFKYFIKGNPFGEAFAKRYSEHKVPLFEFVEDWYKFIGKIEKLESKSLQEVAKVWAYGIKLKKV